MVERTARLAAQHGVAVPAITCLWENLETSTYADDVERYLVTARR